MTNLKLKLLTQEQRKYYKRDSDFAIQSRVDDLTEELADERYKRLVAERTLIILPESIRVVGILENYYQTAAEAIDAELEAKD